MGVFRTAKDAKIAKKVDASSILSPLRELCVLERSGRFMKRLGLLAAFLEFGTAVLCICFSARCLSMQTVKRRAKS